MKALALLLTLLCLTGCGAYLDAQRTAASAMAITANAATKALEDDYRTRLKGAVDNSQDLAEYEQRKAIIVELWAPLWAAHDKLRLLHEHWAELVDSEDPSFFNIPRLKATYCNFRQIADDVHDVEMPDVGCSR